MLYEVITLAREAIHAHPEKDREDDRKLFRKRCNRQRHRADECVDPAEALLNAYHRENRAEGRGGDQQKANELPDRALQRRARVGGQARRSYNFV